MGDYMEKLNAIPDKERRRWRRRNKMYAFLMTFCVVMCILLFIAICTLKGTQAGYFAATWMALWLIVLPALFIIQFGIRECCKSIWGRFRQTPRWFVILNVGLLISAAICFYFGI